MCFGNVKMFKRLGLDWRISLAQSYWFYFRTCENWRQVLDAIRRDERLDRFVLRSGATLTFFGDPPLQIFQEIWRREIYTHEYPQGWRTPHIVVDIGANIGFFSLYVAMRWPDAQVFAYEPAPENVALLEQNIRLSKTSQVILHPVAVADVVGRMNFFLKKESGWHSLWGSSNDSTILVNTTTLPAIVKEVDQTIDLLKMDCEGAEYAVLAGQALVLAQSVRFVAMEYHEIEGHQVRELTEILEQAGFDCEVHPQPRWQTGMLYAVNSRMK